MDENGAREGTRLLRRPATRLLGTGRPHPVALVRQLAEAKAELARELEANLQQLREVLAQTERIARDMERVLQEVQAPAAPRPGPGERGPDGGGGGGRKGQK